jgi:hypothetical protein
VADVVVWISGYENDIKQRLRMKLRRKIAFYIHDACVIIDEHLYFYLDYQITV